MCWIAPVDAEASGWKTSTAPMTAASTSAAAAPTTTGHGRRPDAAVGEVTGDSPQVGTDVQADLGVDDDLLGGGHAIDLEHRGHGDVALEQGERDRPELVVAGRAADEPDRTT